MKANKTIRKLPPLARKAARLSRSVHSIQRQLDSLTDAISELEFDHKAFWKAQERWGVVRAAEKATQQETEALLADGVQP